MSSKFITSFVYPFLLFCFFFKGFLSRPLTTHRIAGEGRGPFFIPPAHEHSEIYLQLCIWDDYHMFLIATLVFTYYSMRFYHLIELQFDWLMMWSLFLVSLLDDFMLGFCYSNLDAGNRWTRTRINYHPCITSEPTNQVCSSFGWLWTGLLSADNVFPKLSW